VRVVVAAAAVSVSVSVLPLLSSCASLAVVCSCCVQLLDSHFPDPKVRQQPLRWCMTVVHKLLTACVRCAILQVRAFAVKCLDGLSDDQLEVFMLQLVQVRQT
jgi:hypothetical protein